MVMLGPPGRSGGFSAGDAAPVKGGRAPVTQNGHREKEFFEVGGGRAFSYVSKR
jgi:hypothetical protein